MRRLAYLSLSAALLAGCGSNYVGTVNTGGGVVHTGAAAAAGGTSVISGPEGLYVSIGLGAAASNFLFWLTGAGIYAAMLADDRNVSLRLLTMTENRTVVEVDCTQPLPPGIQGNIKCK
jgi:hypothetical protein